MRKMQIDQYVYRVTKSYVCISNFYTYNINLRYFDKSLKLKMLLLHVPLVPPGAFQITYIIHNLNT